MTTPAPVQRFRFGVFEADSATGELRRGGVRIKLHAQPFQVLLLLLERPGTLLTREELARELWPEGTFVDNEHGLNSAVNRIREALGDTARNPRFVETLARRGYRFVAPVERMVPAEASVVEDLQQPSAAVTLKRPGAPEAAPRRSLLATADDLPNAPYAVVQLLFILLQAMYLAFYLGALANLPEIGDLLAPLPYPAAVLIGITVTAALLIPVRTFMLSAALFHAPRVRESVLRLWPFLLPFDILWALSPFLLLHHIHYGLALGCMALLVYSPFAQRSLVIMGAGVRPEPPPGALPAGH